MIDIAGGMNSNHQPGYAVAGQQPSGKLWSTIETTPYYVGKLDLLCHSVKELQNAGYVTESLSEAALQTKLRCENCGVRFQKGRLKQLSRNMRRRVMTTPKPLGLEGSTPATTLTVSTACLEDGEGISHPDVELQAQSEISEANRAVDPPGNSRRVICHYHPGKLCEKHFTCCQQHVSTPGCFAATSHSTSIESRNSLQEYWRFHTTPSASEVQRRLAPAPRNRTSVQRRFPVTSEIRKAVALDCEMGTASSGESELIRVTAVDFFSGEVLVDKLVQPSVPMKHFNTKYSGVKWSDMKNAVRSGTCIFGRDMARQQMWRFVGPETVVVAHGGNNDLTALRWIHPRIIDTFILESYDGQMVEGGHSLKNLCLKRLARSIQNGKGHCSREDAFACRELAHWLALQIPSD